MKISIKRPKNNFTARFIRAIFFVFSMFLPYMNLDGGVYSVSFSKNSTVKTTGDAHDRMAFLREGHETLGNTGYIRHHTLKKSLKQSQQKHKSPQDLLIAYDINPNVCLELQNFTCREMSQYLKTKSKEELTAIKQLLQKFLYKFNHDKSFRKSASRFSQIGRYKTKKIGKQKVLGHRKKIPALKHFVNHAYQAVCKALKNLEDSFLDFCHNVLKVKIGKTALYLLQRFMMGLEEGGIDIRNILREEKQKGLHEFAPSFLQNIKNQPVKKTMGDVVQLLSKKIVHASAIIVAVAAIAITIEAGVAAATSATSALAAKKLFEPFTLSINPDGTAAIEQAASSGVSVWQVIAVSLSQAAQALSGLAEQAGNLFVAMGDGDKPASTPIGRRGNPLNCYGSNVSKKINGRKFTGHALDRMQGRGITPSIVENVIKNGNSFPGNTPDTTIYILKNVKVITNSLGDVVTVIPQ